MNIVIIHGQSHRGSTYHIASNLASMVGGEVKEFFLPRDFKSFCLGCTNCFMKGEQFCPHYAELSPITEALDNADLIILASPTYVFHATGGMKNLLDHYGYRWMAHRPEKKMFAKQAVVVSTAAGMGSKKAMKDMEDSLFYWGVSRIYRCGVSVGARSWEETSPKKKAKIDARLRHIASSIKHRHGNVKPTLKGKLMFAIMRLAQKKAWNPLDQEHWQKQGWLEKKRPWKD